MGRSPYKAPLSGDLGRGGFCALIGTGLLVSEIRLLLGEPRDRTVRALQLPERELKLVATDFFI